MGSIMSTEVSIAELEQRAAALEQELEALRSVIAARRATEWDTQNVAAESPPALITAAQKTQGEPADASELPEKPETPAEAPELPHDCLRLSAVLSDGSRWDIAVPFGELARPGGVSIGRSPELADLLLDDPGISRRHVLLELGDQGVTARDLGSTNGSAVNGMPLAPDAAMTLLDGDVLSLAAVDITISFLL